MEASNRAPSNFEIKGKKLLWPGFVTANLKWVVIPFFFITLFGEPYRALHAPGAQHNKQQINYNPSPMPATRSWGLGHCLPPSLPLNGKGKNF